MRRTQQASDQPGTAVGARFLEQAAQVGAHRREGDAEAARDLLVALARAQQARDLGFARREQLKLATSVLGEPVRAFTQLSEADALEVWASAKRLSKRIA